MVAADSVRQGSSTPPVDAAVTWQALAHDTGSAVAVVDVEGEVRYSNTAFDRMLGLDAGTAAGQMMHEVLPRAIAEEWCELVREVATRCQPRTVQGMVNATWRFTTYRPLGVGPDGRASVLIVCNAGTEDGPRAPDGSPYPTARTHDLGRLSVLTSRELEILRLIAQGMSTAEVAKHLHRSVKTIEWHRVALGAKLGVSNRVELARIAYQAGLVRLERT